MNEEQAKKPAIRPPVNPGALFFEDTSDLARFLVSELRMVYDIDCNDPEKFVCGCIDAYVDDLKMQWREMDDRGRDLWNDALASDVDAIVDAIETGPWAHDDDYIYPVGDLLSSIRALKQHAKDSR